MVTCTTEGPYGRWRRQCVECGRVFDLLDPNDAKEWFYGHDCEA